MRTWLRMSYYAIAAAIGFGLIATTTNIAFASDEGTAAEAKAMLKRAVAALKRDESAALKAFTSGTSGFKDRDLYVFCSGPDGMMTAHGANAALIGKYFCGFKDKAGKPFGQEMCTEASEQIKIVEYMWPRPGESEPTQKASYYAKVGGQICGVGFYK